mmetsp:Transcript_28708/g.78800  ORF Transcript_28708/g.78800 Transcript_28708/m.78800 type:complete len:273 (-) Transcript_28708:99-917(-)
MPSLQGLSRTPCWKWFWKTHGMHLPSACRAAPRLLRPAARTCSTLLRAMGSPLTAGRLPRQRSPQAGSGLHSVHTMTRASSSELPFSFWLESLLLESDMRPSPIWSPLRSRLASPCRLAGAEPPPRGDVDTSDPHSREVRRVTSRFQLCGVSEEPTARAWIWGMLSQPFLLGAAARMAWRSGCPTHRATRVGLALSAGTTLFTAMGATFKTKRPSVPGLSSLAHATKWPWWFCCAKCTGWSAVISSLVPSSRRTSTHCAAPDAATSTARMSE